MKTQIFISHQAAPDTLPMEGITVLPCHITFSDVEEYSSLELDTDGFIKRITLDKNAMPIIGSALKEETFQLFDLAIKGGCEQFYFLVSEMEMEHYNPIIDEYKKEHPDLQVLFYEPKSRMYPHLLMAMEAASMFSSGRTPEDVTNAIVKMDDSSKIYLYSPENDMSPAIEKFSYDEDIIKITGKKSYMHIFSEGKVTEIHLKEKYKDISNYFTMYKEDIKDKNVIPFVLYTHRESKYTEYILRILKQLFGTDEIRSSFLPEWAAMEYGMNSIAIGFTAKAE